MKHSWTIGLWVLFMSLPQAFCGQKNLNSVRIDSSSPGLVFVGVGALSAGAASILLKSYPDKQRSEILDLLFEPACGAAFHYLKVEIGGDINSTDGTEPSHARTRSEMENPRPEYFNRGYEWWLMKEAKKRNPEIKLDILQRGAPGWIGDRPEAPRTRSALSIKGNQHFFEDIKKKPAFFEPDFSERWHRFYSQDNVDYIISYIIGLKKYHDLTIDYCGIWNEVQQDASWIKLLRRTLNDKDLKHIGIVAADQCFDNRWGISDEMLDDPELMDSIANIGAHYPSSWGMPTANAKKTGKPLSASEECDWGALDWNGAMKYAHTFNRNYIEGSITRNIVWNALVAYNDILPAATRGPMRANQPWSGHYDISPGIWAFAHTTQFTKIGWRYLNSGCGPINGGSYVTLCDPSHPDIFSTIIESSQAKESQTLNIQLADNIHIERLHVWKSSAKEQFIKQADLPVVGGRIAMQVEPQCLYSVTTTADQGKATFNPPPAGRFPLPYQADFENCEILNAAPYFTDLGGAFEVMKRPDENGQCLKQVISQPGIDWFWVTPAVLSIVGDSTWKDYHVSCDARSDGRGKVVLYGRLNHVALAKNHESFPINTYSLELDVSSKWKLKAGQRTIAEGASSPSEATAWHHLEMEFNGTQITAWIDHKQVANLADKSFRTGMVGVGSGWHAAWFDHLIIRPIVSKIQPLGR